MNKIKSFIKLNSTLKFILIKAFFLLLTVRILLWILPFSFIKKIIPGFIVVSEDMETSEISTEKLTWAIRVMSIYTPKATCLTRAIAAQILLARYNYSSTIKIGVFKNEEEFEAHAWLEAEGGTILGESETEYTPIMDMG
jgi:hypothetical protein